MMGTLTDALLEVHDVLVQGSLPHALCGGIAANLYRDKVRATTDVDAAIAVSPTALLRLTALFADRRWKAEPYWRKGEQLRLTRAELPRIDCIIATTDYERSAIERAGAASIEGQEIRFSDPRT